MLFEKIQEENIEKKCLTRKYTGINYKIFSKFPYSMLYTLGRIAEMFTFAAA